MIEIQPSTPWAARVGAIVFVVLIAGCASTERKAQAGPPPSTDAERSTGVPRPAASTAKAAPNMPPIPPRSPSPVAPPSKATTPPAAALATPPPAAPLDLKSLEARLKETKAIGVFTKLTVKNQVDDLLDRFRAFYLGRLETSLVELRRSYDLLVLKVLALLQDADPPLAGAIAASRESIWAILSDRSRFAAV